MDNNQETTDEKPQEKSNSIPGFLTSINNWYCMSKLQYKGQLFFSEEQRRHKCNIFRVNLGYDAVTILTNEESQILFDRDKVEKEDCYGIALQNLQLLTNYPASSLWSDQAKKDRRSLMNDVIQLTPINYFIKVVSDTIKEHFQCWEDKYEGNGRPGHWERDIQEFCSNTISSLILGTRMEFQCVSDCLQAMLMISRLFFKTGTFNRGSNATKILLQQIEKSPNYIKIAKIGECYSLNPDIVKINLLYVMIAKLFRTSNTLMRSIAARINVLPLEQRARIIQSTCHVLSEHSGLSEDAMLAMTDLKSFVMEVIRTSPSVSLIYGKAVKDFTITADGSTFNIRQGQRLLTNLYWANRDAKSFNHPGEFQPFRFAKDPSLKAHLLWEYGLFTDESDGLEKPIFYCLELFSLYLLLQSRFTLYKTPTWNATMIRRHGCPDEEIYIELFQFIAENKIIPVRDVANARSLLFSAGNQYYVIKTTTTTTRQRNGQTSVEISQNYKSGEGKDGIVELRSVLKDNDIDESLIHTINHSTTSNLGGGTQKNVVIRKTSRKQKQPSVN